VPHTGAKVRSALRSEEFPKSHSLLASGLKHCHWVAIAGIVESWSNYFFVQLRRAHLHFVGG
jgi:hypothetical protein